MLEWTCDPDVDEKNRAVWRLENPWIDDPVLVKEKFTKRDELVYVFKDFSGKKHKFADRNEAFLFAIEAAVEHLLDIIG
jgi:hypothetical protein